MAKTEFNLLSYQEKLTSQECKISGSVDLDLQSMRIRYEVTGSRLDEILIPEPVRPDFFEGLWENTCFEIFLSTKGRKEYIELNFSPSSQYAYFLFSDHRCRIDDGIKLSAPRISFEAPIGQSLLRCRVMLQASEIFHLMGSTDLEAGITAVIEMESKEKYYFAQKFPAPKLDFHHRDSFLSLISV